MGFAKSAGHCVFFKPNLQFFVCQGVPVDIYTHRRADMFQTNSFSPPNRILAVVGLGSSPTPAPLPSISLTGDTEDKMRKRDNLPTGERGRG
jgi:hypothetical protein